MITFDNTPDSEAMPITNIDFGLAHPGFMVANIILDDIPLKIPHNGQIAGPVRVMDRGSIAHTRRQPLRCRLPRQAVVYGLRVSNGKCESRITNRSASFTAASEGKALAISASRRTMFMPFRHFAAYLPITPRRSNGRKLYFGRKSSTLPILDFVFILAPF